MFNMRLTILATCSLDALPFPVMAFLTLRGSYSATGICLANAVAMATPCALPNFSADCTLAP